MKRAVTRVTLVFELTQVGPVPRDRGTVAHALRNLVMRDKLIWAPSGVRQQTAYRIDNVHIEHSDQVQVDEPDKEDDAA